MAVRHLNGDIRCGLQRQLNKQLEEQGRSFPGVPAPARAHDPRWQAMIAIADFIPSEPEPVWTFVERWGKTPQRRFAFGDRVRAS